MLNRANLKNLAKTILIDEGWLVNIIIGVVAAKLVPNFILLQNLSSRAQAIVWGFTFLFGTEFAKMVFKVPKQVTENLKGFKDEITIFDKRIAKTFYKGFYTLLAGDELRRGLQQLDNALSESTIKGDLRDLIFGFMAKSISKLGESGLVMVNAPVNEYVQLLKRVLLIPDLSVRAICVVRPYWFVTNEIPKISLSPSQKAAHLPYFKNHLPKALRILVVDETMIAEMLLTAFIDMEILKQNNDCPFCKGAKTCPIHKNREKENLPQIPEIFWFEQDVNSGVDFKYTHIHSSFKGSCSELEDRVYITDNKHLKIDIRFSFTNLSTGIMWLKWGDKAQEFPDYTHTDRHGIFELKSKEREKPHSLYQSFWNNDPTENTLLKVSNIGKIEAHLKWLSQLVSQHFKGTANKVPDAQLKALLPDNLQGRIEKAINNLLNNLYSQGKDIFTIYQDVLKHYETNGIPKVAYIVSYDKAHPELPVRVAFWHENWQGLIKQIGEELN